MNISLYVPVCRGVFGGLQNKHEPYVPFWTDTASPGQHWAELAEALPPESEVCGHRAWPRACIHTHREAKKKRGREQRDGVLLRKTFKWGKSLRDLVQPIETDALLAKS